MQVSARGIAIEVDDQGPPGGEPLLMIMGLGMQLIAWPDALVQMLVARGFRVIRIDNRDVGLSQGFDAAGVPNLLWAAMRHAVHLPVASPYLLSDMAGDALGVLDALKLKRVHVCGASMGGMIAQHLASAHPQRVKSLTLMMTSSGARGLPRARPQVQRALLSRPRGRGDEAVAAHLQHIFELIGSPAYRGDPARTARAGAGQRAARLPPGRHGAPVAGHRRRRRPLAVAGPHHGAHARDPWRGRPAGAGRLRPRPGAPHRRRAGRHGARHGA